MSRRTATPWVAPSSTTEAQEAYARRTTRASALLAAAEGLPDAPLGLAKRSSNLFRDRVPARKLALDLGEFDHVIAVNPAAGWVDTEGLVSYEALVDATLPHGVMPAVVPQLKSITAGGAVAGVGIEATSFRHGLVHDTLLEADVLLPDGRVITCRPDNDAQDLFFGLPNSYGTLGYALRLRLRTLPVRPFVQVQHLCFRQPAAFFDALALACDDATADFVDGVVFGGDDLVLNIGRFVDSAPHTSDYGYLEMYHQSLHRLPQDWLHTRDWLWRWDTDWFWCSANFGVDRRWVRRLLGRSRLNSRTYTRWMRWNARLGLSRRLAHWQGWAHVESVIQDVDLPLPKAPDFLEFLLAEVGILPIWICPIRAADPARPTPLYRLPADTRSVNFGFWDVVRRAQPLAEGHVNRRIEQRVIDAGGIKSLYSDAYFSREQFAQAYGMDDYDALKRRYDPQHRLLDLYDKCVLRA
jgi:FAD/FMN-containing dehydrogenase